MTMPASPWIVPSLLLVLVLVVSGAFKLRDTASTASAFHNLRLPGVLKKIHAPALLPWGELALAALLLFVPAPAFVAVAAVVALLMAVYLAVVARALGFAEEIHCNCFGKLGLGTIDTRTVMRNALLVVAGLLATVDGARGGSMIERFTQFSGTEWAWTAGVIAAVLLTGVIMYAPAQATATAPVRPVAGSFEDEAGEELDYLRQPIPYGQLRDLDDQMFSLVQLAAGKPVLLVSVSLGCGSCTRTMEILPEWASGHPTLRTIMTPIGEPPRGQLPEMGDHVEWMYDPERRVGVTLQMGAPSAVLLGADGQLAGGPVHGFEAVKEFLDDIDTELREAQEAFEAARAQA